MSENIPDVAEGARLELSNSGHSSLVQRAKEQDPEARRRLVELCGPLVYRSAQRAGLQSHDAADLVQEVFTTLVAHVSDFRGQHARRSFMAWLRTITRNKICDQFRRTNKPDAAGPLVTNPPVPAAVASTDLASSEQPREDTILLTRALELASAQFEHRTWQAFWRVVVDGQAPCHVAQDLGMTRHAVYKAKSRILSRLRHDLAGLADW